MVRISTLPLIVLCASSWFAARSPEDNSPRKQLQAAYVIYDKAVKLGMPGMQKWCEENLAPEFSIVFADGNTLNRKQYLEMLDRLVKNPAPAWKDVKGQKTRLKKLAMQAADAVATVDIETTYATKNPKRRQISLERSYKETWTKVGDTWKVKRTEEIEPKPVAVAKPGSDRPRRPDFPNPRGGGQRGPYPGGRQGYPGG